MGQGEGHFPDGAADFVDFSGGLNVATNQFRLRDNEYRDGNNIYIDIDGRPAGPYTVKYRTTVTSIP